MYIPNIQIIDLAAFLEQNPEMAYVKFSFTTSDSKEEKELAACKLILSCGSPVFRTQFFGSIKNQDFINVKDASFDAFKTFLDIFYNTNVIWDELSFDLLGEVFYLAEKYHMDPLKNIKNKTCADKKC